MEFEEQNIIEKINKETEMLNDEVKRLVANYQEEKKQCDDLQRSYDNQLKEIELLKEAIMKFEENHKKVELKIQEAESEILKLHANK